MQSADQKTLQGRTILITIVSGNKVYIEMMLVKYTGECMASTIKINITISDDLRVGINTVIPTKYQYVRQGERIFAILMLLFGSTPYRY